MALVHAVEHVDLDWLPCIFRLLDHNGEPVVDDAIEDGKDGSTFVCQECLNLVFHLEGSLFVHVKVAETELELLEEDWGAIDGVISEVWIIL